MRRYVCPGIGAARWAARWGVVGVVLLGAAPPVPAQCPASTIGLPYSGSEQTETPTFEGADDGGWVRGDHLVGQYTLHYDGSLSPTVIVARDRYDATGVTPGSPRQRAHKRLA